MSWQQRALDRFYDRARGFVDGTAEFHKLCESTIPAGSRILEIGAGPSNASSDFFATRGVLTGLDVDPDVRGNRALADSVVFDGAQFPFPDASFDVCVSNYVVEHVPDPALHLEEIRRVLVPGGAYVFRTPNRYHYVGLVSSLTPHWFHELVANRLRGFPRDAHDPYPTVYAMNSRGALRRLARNASLTVEQLRLIEKEPSYGMASRLAFYPLLAYERAVNSSEIFAGLRGNILAVLRKPTES
jgi:SAM-dependent methyltransferase